MNIALLRTTLKMYCKYRVTQSSRLLQLVTPPPATWVQSVNFFEIRLKKVVLACKTNFKISVKYVLLFLPLRYYIVIIKSIFLQNRELQIMRRLEHCNIVKLKYFFYSSGEKVEIYIFTYGFY